MRDPRKSFRRIAPEIVLFANAEDARAAIKKFNRSYFFTARFWLSTLLLMLVVGLGTFVLDMVAIPFLGRHGLPSWINGGIAGFVGGGVFGFWGQFLMRRPMRRYLRETLVATGVPVCLECGYDLRGLDKPRCPECGAPFDEALLGGENRTPNNYGPPQEQYPER